MGTGERLLREDSVDEFAGEIAGTGVGPDEARGVGPEDGFRYAQCAYGAESIERLVRIMEDGVHRDFNAVKANARLVLIQINVITLQK